jgi:hypothetical protein
VDNHLGDERDHFEKSRRGVGDVASDREWNGVDRASEGVFAMQWGVIGLEVSKMECRTPLNYHDRSQGLIGFRSLMPSCKVFMPSFNLTLFSIFCCDF